MIQQQPVLEISTHPTAQHLLQITTTESLSKRLQLNTHLILAERTLIRRTPFLLWQLMLGKSCGNFVVASGVVVIIGECYGGN